MGYIGQAPTDVPLDGDVCQAWVNFNGAGTVSINDSFNVSSITDITTGAYRVTYTNAMSNTDYSVVANNIGSTSSWSVRTVVTNYENHALTTTTCAVNSIRFDTSNTIDMDAISVQIFGS